MTSDRQQAAINKQSGNTVFEILAGVLLERVFIYSSLPELTLVHLAAADTVVQKVILTSMTSTFL